MPCSSTDAIVRLPFLGDHAAVAIAFAQLLCVMPSVYPFSAVAYAQLLNHLADAAPADLSAVLAPPYDVLDASGKARLVAKSAHNMVLVDLPHLPAKQLGPAEAYTSAAALLGEWLATGVLKRREKPCLFAYRQTFVSGGKTVQRSGMIGTLDVRPFGPAAGGGILPHEETFSGPKEDRLALMKATRTQLSPIFGLHADEQGLAAKLVVEVCARSGPDAKATTDDGTLHEVWIVEDEPTVARYQSALAGQDVFIADGHHRYNTALNYLRELEAAGSVAADHQARRCMFVLISMADAGLVIWPTHRVLGGMKGYSRDAFIAAAGKYLVLEPIAGGLEATAKAMEDLEGMGPGRFGLFDVASGYGYVAIPGGVDPLQARFASKPKAWRDLTVAFVQHVLVEEVCQPKLNDGQPINWAFPHTVAEVAQICKGGETGAGGGKGFVAQLVVLVRATPLEAVRDVSRAGELMPQKSTFFYPKLATGIALHGLG